MKYLFIKQISEAQQVLNRISENDPHLSFILETYSCKATKEQKKIYGKNIFSFLTSSLDLCFPDYNFLELLEDEISCKMNSTAQNCEIDQEFNNTSICSIKITNKTEKDKICENLRMKEIKRSEAAQRPVDNNFMKGTSNFDSLHSKIIQSTNIKNEISNEYLGSLPNNQKEIIFNNLYSENIRMVDSSSTKCTNLQNNLQEISDKSEEITINSKIVEKEMNENFLSKENISEKKLSQIKEQLSIGTEFVDQKKHSVSIQDKSVKTKETLMIENINSKNVSTNSIVEKSNKKSPKDSISSQISNTNQIIPKHLEARTKEKINKKTEIDYTELSSNFGPKKSFSQVKLQEIKTDFQNFFAMLQLSEQSEIINMLLRIIDKTIKIRKCIFYKFNKRSGPFEDASRFFCYFFYNKTLKRIVIFSATYNKL